MTLFLIIYESVKKELLHRFLIRRPISTLTRQEYVQMTVNSEIPDECWEEVKVAGFPPQVQELYEQLVYWEAFDMEFVRKVQLYRAEIDPVWVKVE